MTDDKLANNMAASLGEKSDETRNTPIQHQDREDRPHGVRLVFIMFALFIMMYSLAPDIVSDQMPLGQTSCELLLI